MTPPTGSNLTFLNYWQMEIISHHYPIPNDLKSVFDGIWSYKVEGAPTEISPVQFCLPGGMIELIFHTSPSTHEVFTRGKWTKAPAAMIVGLHQEPIFFTTNGGTSMLGLNIKPEAMVSLFDKPVGQLAQNFASLHDFLGSNEMGKLTEQIISASDEAAGVKLTIDYFRQRLAASAHHEQHYLPKAMEYIRSSTGTQSVDAVAEKVFVGKRQLQRVFQEQFGISPKTYGRIVRFKSAYDFVQRYPKASWVDVTYHFGYSDQSHFIRDFKEFTGNNPSVFLSEFVPQSNVPFALGVQ